MKTSALLTAIAIAAVGASVANAQSDSIHHEKSVLERLDIVEKKTDKLNVYLNMHGDFAVQESAGEFLDGKFQMRQLRIEAKGNINSWLSYRYRQALNKGDSQKGTLDNVLSSVDNAWLGVKLGRWQLTMGKQCSALGGFEFDLNPIEIYEASDINGTGISYVTGVDVAYGFTPSQELHFQVANSSPLSAKEQYGDYAAAKMPLIYTLNWNGNFGSVYHTRWSASLMQQVKGKQEYYFALGNELALGDFGTYLDCMYAREGVDLRGIVTGIVGGTDPIRRTADTEYLSFVWHVNYRFAAHWNVFAKLMLENEGVYSTHRGQRDGADIEIAKGKYRTAYGYIGGIEYYPLSEGNLHFFVTYVGRSYQYTSLAQAYGASSYTTNRLSVGFIWKMPVF